MVSEIFTSPYSWCLISAIFLGLALSQTTRGIINTNDRERDRARKWTWITLNLSLSIIFALIGVFIPGPEKIQDIRLLYFFGGITAASFVGFRFKRLIGLPLVFLVLMFVLAISLFLQSITAFKGETELALVRVLRIESPDMQLEVNLPNKGSEFMTLAGDYFAPVVRVIIFDDAFVFLGAKTWYRFDGFTSFFIVNQNGSTVFRQSDSIFSFSRPMGISEKLYEFFERHEHNLPGVKSVQVEIDLKRVSKSDDWQEYSIRIQADGGVQIVRTD